jgi:hypothetical protein
MPPKGSKKAKQPLLRTFRPELVGGACTRSALGERDGWRQSCQAICRLWMCKMWGVLWVWRRDEIVRACVNSGLRMCGCAERGCGTLCM